MKTLPNGLTIFNATPHVIRFWHEEWESPVEVETDEVISASVREEKIGHVRDAILVSTTFEGNEYGRIIIAAAQSAGVDLIVGSIIAAQAYPGLVVAMTPAPGYERVPPTEKRMNPDKFTVIERKYHPIL